MQRKGSLMKEIQLPKHTWEVLEREWSDYLAKEGSMVSINFACPRENFMIGEVTFSISPWKKIPHRRPKSNKWKRNGRSVKVS